MIKQFEKLTKEEATLLFKAPALVSVLAASGNHQINEKEKADAIKLSHIKEFSADPMLLNYYSEVEKNFETDFETIVKKYVPFNDTQRNLLKEEINVLNKTISLLEPEFANMLHRSLTRYAQHVKKAERSIVEDFIFPFPINGLTD